MVGKFKEAIRHPWNRYVVLPALIILGATAAVSPAYQKWSAEVDREFAIKNAPHYVKAYDSNKDGRLDESELAKLLQDLHPNHR